eukprot:SAG31_NODE_1537_length_7982_cov_2.277813_10_plen_52_part_00
MCVRVGAGTVLNLYFEVLDSKTNLWLSIIPVSRVCARVCAGEGIRADSAKF